MLSSLGAAIGVGGAGGIAGIVGAAPAAAGPRELTLYGSQLQILGDRQRVVAGGIRTVRGALHTSSQASGSIAGGEFFSTGAVLAESRLLDPDLGFLETHLFRLAGSTLTGSGTLHHDGTGLFTITGGSGRFAGAQGTYQSRQSADHSGTGSAEFHFRIG